jgi:hypothetical protein
LRRSQDAKVNEEMITEASGLSGPSEKSGHGLRIDRLTGEWWELYQFDDLRVATEGHLRAHEREADCK